MSAIELPHTHGCLVCGRANRHGLHLSLHVDDATGVVGVTFVPRVEDIGFEGIVHGGLIATVVDEAMVWAATWAGGRFCVCGELAVRYRRPVRVGETVRVTATVASSRARLVSVAAEVRTAGGEVAATATGKYVPVPEATHRSVVASFVDEPATRHAADRLRGGYSAL